MSKKLTTAAGCPVAHNQNVQTAGKRGPQLLASRCLVLEKMAHFDREVIQSVTYAREKVQALTVHLLLRTTYQIHQGKTVFWNRQKTDLFARFTTVAGERGAADAERDIRGFTWSFILKKVTGIWWVITLIFFLRDPLKFPDLNHAVKRDPPLPVCAVRRTTGISGLLYLKRFTKLPSWWVTVVFLLRIVTCTVLVATRSTFINADERFWVKFRFQISARY